MNQQASATGQCPPKSDAVPAEQSVGSGSRALYFPFVFVVDALLAVWLLHRAGFTPRDAMPLR